MASQNEPPVTPDAPARVPTMYFFGVTTARSSINKVFPLWAEALGLGECRLAGVDFRLHDDPERYRAMVRFLKEDPLSLGALVTTHKIDLLAACRDLFDRLDPLAELMGEVSSIYKRGGCLAGRAVDSLTSGLALDAFLPAGHWERTGAEALILGAGGSSVALSYHLTKPEHGANRPSRILVSNRSAPRLEALRALHARLGHGVPVECRLAPRLEDNDALLAQLPPGSLVVNATGLGKDAPGSPLTDAAVFPRDGWVWEFNYRGDLVFLQQARARAQADRLTIEDGWVYFLHGWTRVIADVFDVEIPTAGPRFEELSRLAASARG